MGLNSVFFVCTFINTPVLGQNDSLIPPNHHKLLKSDPRSALYLNHPVFCWHKFLQWFWSAFLVAFDVFTNISKVHLLRQWVYRYWVIFCTCMVGSFLVGRQSSMIIWPPANVKIWYGIVTLSCKFFNIPSHTSLLTSLPLLIPLKSVLKYIFQSCIKWEKLSGSSLQDNGLTVKMGLSYLQDLNV